MMQARDKFNRVLMSVLEQEATSEEREEFRMLLKQHPEFMALYREQMLMHTLLTGVSETIKEGEEVRTCGSPEVSRPIGSYRWVKVAAALALLLGGLGGGTWLSKSRSLAEVKEVYGQVLVSGTQEVTPAQVGTVLFSGDEVALEGEESGVTLVWRDGSMIRLPCQTRVTLAQTGKEKRITLLHGYFDADFSKQCNGQSFVIITPQGRATVLGTSLRISTGAQDTRLSVIRGLVRFETYEGGLVAKVSSRREVRSSAIEKGKLKTDRFYWADRFSGGRNGGTASATTERLAVKQ
ncbi:MAG: FecR family protein [bacterium]